VIELPNTVPWWLPYLNFGGWLVNVALVLVLLWFEMRAYRRKMAVLAVNAQVLDNVLNIQRSTRETLHEVRNHLAVIKGWIAVADEVKAATTRAADKVEQATEKAIGRAAEVVAAADSKTGSSSL
jgi:antirestriction protein ArdC